MKKGANKLISVFMSVVMLAMLFVGTDISVFNVKAATNTNFTRAEWIHDLVTTFEMEVGENQMPDNYFTDVSSTDTYYEDIMKAVSFGVIDIEAGKEFKPNDDATREFVASTLNFCLGCELQNNTYTFTDSNDCNYPEDDQVAVNRGWFLLSNGKFMPNEKVTGSESQLILSDAKKEIDKQDVSQDYDSKWDINSNVKEVPYGTDVQIDENVVTIKGLNIEINKGDVFVVYQGEIATPFKANDVQKEGNVTTINTEDVTDYSEAFKNVDAEGVIESDELTFEALDGTKLEIENDTEEIEKSKTIKRNVRATTKKLKDAKFSKTFKISGNLSSAINGTFSNIKIKYNISTSSGETFVQIEGDLNMTGSIAATAGMSVPIMQVGVPGVGGVTLSADIKAEGKLNSTIATHVVTGISYSKSTGFRTIKSFKENGGSNTSTEASASMGASLKCGITDLKVITGYVYAKAGVKAQIVNTVWESGQPRNCRTFLAYMYASYGAEASCKFVAKKYQKEENIYTLSNSPMRVYHHYEDNMQVSECTRGQTFSYFTKYYSSYWGTGWSGCDSSYGLDDEGKPYAVYEYKVEQDSSKNDYATIVKYSGNMRNLTIPETLDGYTVKKIANNVFEGNKYICTLTIPDTIVEIGAGAFLKCSDLSNVTLSKGLTKMGGYAFGDCDSLTSIEIPKSLKETTSQYYMNYIYDYHYGVFIASDNLKNVTFEEGTTTIANGLFAHNTSLENITIPDTVTEIGNNAFENCTNLKTIKLSSSLTKIGSDAFQYVKGLTTVKIPDTVVEIGAGAFLGCSNLSNVTLSKGLTEMGGYAFGDCDSLTSIEIPKSLKETTSQYYMNYIYDYHYGVFIASDNLKNVTFEEGTTTIANGLFAHNTSLENITIPDTVTEIRDNAFENCTSLKTIKLSQKLETMGSNVFEGAKELKEIEIPDTVTSMGEKTFYNCINLSKVKLPNTRQNIGSHMFYNCTSLENIEFPDTVTYIRDSAFENSGIKKIKMSPNVVLIDAYAFKNTPLEEIQFSGKEEEVGVEAFKNCDSLTAVNIPDKVNTIGKGVFQDCDMLTNVRLGLGISNIPQYAFEHCDKLQSIVIPYNVKSIESNAFANSIAISEVTIPRATTKISENAFSYPSRMTVYGIKGTYAETFANEQGMTFVNKELNATSVSFDEPNVTLAKKKNKKLVITVAPDGFTDEIIWKSTNPDVVSVDDNGNITAKSVGTATIKVTIGNVSASCNVTVYQPVEWIRLNDSKVSLNVGEKYQLEAYVSPDDTNDKTLEWSSSDKSVAVVDSNGKITAISKGVATITAKAKGVNDVYDTCVVTVKGTNIVSNVQDMKSQHPYDNNADEQWTYTKKGAKKLSITFSSETELEEGFDFLYILDKNGEQVGKYTGKELAGKTITVSGDTIIVKLETDEGGTAFGFEVTKIEEVKQSSSETTDKPTTKVNDTKKTGVQFSKPQNITKLTAKNVKKKRVSLKWQKVAKAKGYQIQYALDRKFKKSRKTKNTSKTSYTIKKLKKKKTYYIRVRAYAIINGKKVYGNWCKAKKIKIKR